MLLASSARANAIPIVTDTRIRPIISGGTLRTDTNQLIRAGRIQGGVAAAKSPATWAACRAAGLNCMRFGVRVADSTPATKFAEIDAVVEAARSNRCYVMLGNPEAPPAAYDDDLAANEAKAIATWQAWAPRYKDEPHVFYEMLNEPEGWGAYTHYSSSTGVPTELTRSLRRVFDVMRSLAPETAILVPSAANIDAGGGVAQYVKAIEAFESLGAVDWSRTAWSFHHYNQTAKMLVNGKVGGSGTDFAADLGAAALAWLRQRYPIICTETNWGFAGEENRQGLLDAADALEDAGVAWSIMHYPGQVYPTPYMFTGDLYPNYSVNKAQQLRDRGYSIPVE